MFIYVAGPMRHRPEFNFPAFDAATEALRAAGHVVFSPAEHDRRNGFRPTGMTGFEDLTRPEYGFSLRAALEVDTSWICSSAQAICLLDGWETSRGAMAEITLAAALGLRAGDVDQFVNDPWGAPYATTFVSLRTRPSAKFPIVGLAGYGRSGKDTAGQILVEEGYERRAFADVLRAILYDLNPVVAASPWGDRFEALQSLMDGSPAAWEQSKSEISGVALRGLLQRLGVAAREHIGADVWVRAVMDNLPQAPTVITDVRFPNEAEAIRALGGKVIRIERPGVGPANDHISEVALDGYDFTAVVENNGSLEDLALAIRRAVSA